ncbi:MAG: hypothetical protein ACLGQU_00850, partial [Acidobacteriota bacterium]
MGKFPGAGTAGPPGKLQSATESSSDSRLTRRSRERRAPQPPAVAPGLANLTGVLPGISLFLKPRL